MSDPAQTDDAAIASAGPAQPAARPRSSPAALVLATLAIGFTLWATQEVLLPILLAMFFALIGNPILRALQKLRIPRVLGAVAILASGIAGAVLMGSLLAEPAGALVRQLPQEIRAIAPKLRKMTKPVQDAKKGAETIARAAGGGENGNVRVVRTENDDTYAALAATPKLLASALAVPFLTLFFMVYGENLQRRALALLPGRQQKNLTIEILQSIEREMSRYVLTVTVINIGMGVVFAGALAALGIPIRHALLWGTLAALLNYAPFVGPLLGVFAMLLMGLVAFDTPLGALMPAAAYLLLHTIESQLVTPIVLGRHMALSPLILILGLMVFGWLWGIVGLLLAVPLLACAKLMLERLPGMEAWAKLLE